MRKLDGKIVRFIAHDRKYRSTPYPAVAPLDTKLNIYVTGQHADPSDPDRTGFLTQEEIIGEIEVAPKARKAKFSPRIDQHTTVLIIHNKPYDCRLDDKGIPVNPKDYWEAQFIIEQTSLVAPTEAKAQSTHKFYLDDKEEAAKLFVSQADEVYAAQKKIHEEANVSEYSELVMALNLSVQGFHVDWRPMNSNRLKEVLLKQAERDPASIVRIFSEQGKDLIFFSQLVEKKILARRPDGYYDGQKFICSDSTEFLRFIAKRDNDSSVSKWGRLLEEMKAKIEA